MERNWEGKVASLGETKQGIREKKKKPEEEEKEKVTQLGSDGARM